ncbi:MAG: hypothetical protein V4532_06565, partial [Pseudomonadota bacterium]
KYGSVELFKNRNILLAASSLCVLCSGTSAAHASAVGLQFMCAPEQIHELRPAMARYLHDLGIQPHDFNMVSAPQHGTLTYTLTTEADDTNTLNLSTRQNFALNDETVRLPDRDKTWRTVETVSQKEIVLALMQHGRLSTFAGRACDVQALKDHVGLRQNIVAWSEQLQWGWPDGGYAKWHTPFWDHGTPSTQWPLEVALLDAFTAQSEYVIGCYTATKLVVLQGITDYYRRVKRDPIGTAIVSNRVMADGDPLVNVEPGQMWSFEDNFAPTEMQRPGKLVKIQYGVSPKNFVPGDWVYLHNTDPVTHKKIGYEGSNALYLGRNRFDDYYNDHAHAYTYEEKIDEVYQWRHGVFSRRRDFANIQPLTRQQRERLDLPPARGGLVSDFRAAPYLFGFEDLPRIAATPAAP